MTPTNLTTQPTPLGFSPDAHPLTIISSGGFYGGCLQGYRRTRYAALLALLGPPHQEDGDKFHVLWTFQCLDGTSCTVYDYKELVDPRTVATAEFRFHIGGNSQRSLEAFGRLTGLATESAF